MSSSKQKVVSSKQEIQGFRKKVWNFYKNNGRHDLPWRKTKDPYKILVSEVMLQQTQVERVLPFYKNFLKRFPTAKALAAAPLSEVLAAWQGLGYNRRAKLLREAAHVLTQKRGSAKLVTVAELEELPGVGPYTARAVAAFAYNTDIVCIETNIRTAVIQHFFSGMKGLVNPTSDVGFTRPHTSGRVSDKEILLILEKTLPKGRAREWYWALMDYGSYLKRSGVRINARSAQYAKQPKFEGSLRQVRGAILKALTAGETLTKIKKQYPDRFDAALAALTKDGLIKKRGRGWCVA